MKNGVLWLKFKKLLVETCSLKLVLIWYNYYRM